jgi:hypothetical protein
MANMFEYIKWRGDLSFSQHPFNPVDNIVFSQLSYLPFDNIVPYPAEDKEITIADAAKIFKGKHDKNIMNIRSYIIFKEHDPALLYALAASDRYKDCKLFGYVNHIDTSKEVQFSAVCINTGDGYNFVAYRGTDLSLVGWKEDLNLGFLDVIPAQQEAVKYLEMMADKIKGPLRVGGHSKGGNVAVYAAANCGKKIQNRISVIYSNDAPGFNDNVLKSDGFAAIKDRIQLFIPQSSIVGMLFEHGCNRTVIRSSKIGLLQHELYSWEVTHNDMIRLEEVTMGSHVLDKTLKDWISNLDNNQREQFCNAFYSILTASEAKSLSELEKSWLKAGGKMLMFIANIDEKSKKLILKTTGELFKAAQRNINSMVKEEISAKGREFRIL